MKGLCSFRTVVIILKSDLLEQTKEKKLNVVNDLHPPVVRGQITSSSSQRYFQTVYSAIDILDNFPVLTSPKLHLFHS